MSRCNYDQQEHTFDAFRNYPEKQGWVYTCSKCGVLEGEAK